MKWVQEKVCRVRMHGCNSGSLRLGQGGDRGAEGQGNPICPVSLRNLLSLCDEESATGADYGC